MKYAASLLPVSINTDASQDSVGLFIKMSFINLKDLLRGFVTACENHGLRSLILVQSVVIKKLLNESVSQIFDSIETQSQREDRSLFNVSYKTRRQSKIAV